MSNRQRLPEELAFNATVGSNIKYLRKTRNLNQSKVAAALSVSFQQIQKYEKGANGLSGEKLKKLADFFKVGCDVLVDPNMITKYRGFSPDIDDKTKRKLEIAKEADRLTHSYEFMKENNVNNKS